MKDNYYIYFLANSYNNVLYVGVTNDIVRRVAEHKAKINKGFTYKYNCDKLVYYEIFPLVTDAIAREKQLKNWKRDWKDKLINDFNPEWKDLSDEIGVNEKYIKDVKAEYNHLAKQGGIAGQARNDDFFEGNASEEMLSNLEVHARNDDFFERNASEGVLSSSESKSFKNSALPSAEKLQNELLNFEIEHEKYINKTK